MFETVIASSVLIAIILFIRRVFKRSISNTLRYSLWLLVAIRLLMPFGIVQSRLSVLNLIKPDSRIAAEPDQNDLPKDGTAPFASSTKGDGINAASPELQTGVFPSGANASSSSAAAKEGENISHSGNNALSAEKQPEASSDTWQSIAAAAKIIWLSITGMMILWYISANAAFYINVKRKRKRLDSGCKLALYSVAGLKSPCLFGFVRPAVYVNEEALEAKSLDYITAHELCHYRHGDIIWAALRYILLAVYWFNPFVWAAAIYSKRDCEYACDEASIRLLGEERRFDYGKALVAMIPGSSPSLSTAGVISTAMSSRGKVLKSRVEFIANKPKKGFLAAFMAVIAAIAAVGCTFTSPKDSSQPENPPKNNPNTSDVLPILSPDNPADSTSHEKTVYWQSGDDIGELTLGYLPGILMSEGRYYYACDGEIIPVTEVMHEAQLVNVYGEEAAVVYLGYIDDNGTVRADTVVATEYIETGRYGSRIYFTDDIMLYCYDKETGEVTLPSTTPFGFSIEDYFKADADRWYTGIRQLGSRLFYSSAKSLSADGSSPANEWGIWSYDMATGEEKRLCRFVENCPPLSQIRFLSDEALLFLEKTQEGYNHYIIDISDCSEDEIIDPGNITASSQRITAVTLPQPSWAVITGDDKSYHLSIDGGEIAVTEFTDMETHIFKADSKVYPNYIEEQKGVLAFHSIKGDCALYIIDTNDDTMTVYKNQPGERQFFQGFTDGEVRVSVFDSETDELIRYEGIELS